MHTRLFFTMMMIALALPNSGFTEEQKWGTLKGQALFDGEIPKLQPLIAGAGGIQVEDESLIVDPKTKGIANVVVYLQKRPRAVHPDLEKTFKVDEQAEKPDEITFRIKDGRFVPHVMLISTTKQIRLINEDSKAGVVHSNPIRNHPFNLLLSPNDEKGRVIGPLIQAEKIPVWVTNDIHPWMRGYWFVLDHPYAVITDKEGKYEILNLPVGEHHFCVWQERKGILIKDYPVQIHEGLNEQKPLELGADRR